MPCCCCTVNEEVKLATLSCLPLWLPRCTAAPDGAVASLLAAGLKDAKESLRKASLRSAAAALSTPGPAASSLAAALAEPCCKVLAEALAKPALRAEGVVALAALAAAAAADPAAAAVADKEKVWGGAGVKADSSLLAAALTTRLPAADCVQAARMCGLLLSRQLARLQGQQGSVEAVAKLLAALLVHYAPEVQNMSQGVTIQRVTCVTCVTTRNSPKPLVTYMCCPCPWLCACCMFP